MKKSLFLFFLMVPFYLFSQNQNSGKEKIEKAYSEYTKIPREVIFTHLNKGLYVKGEALAFSSYIFEKQTKLLSSSTTTLYCEILDSDNKRVDAKMLKVIDGVASNQFDITEDYKSGVYTFKAYTNWLKNFSENNHFESKFTVVEQEELKNNYDFDEIGSIDAQFLAEGGHLLEGVINTIGVVIKKQNGRGLENASGYILENGKKITDFYTNHLGIGVLTMRPKSGAVYKAVVESQDETFEYDFPLVEKNGVTLSVSNEDQLIIQLNTNSTTLPNLKGKTFKVMVHNGNRSLIQEVELKDLKTVLILDNKKLDEGVQIITVFNEEHIPILERLTFNHSKVEEAYLKEAYLVKTKKDSIKFQLQFENVRKDSISKGAFSVSILPQQTLAYSENDDIYSQIYLKPYLKGSVEQAAYYFKENNRKKRYELDCLLMTQGWSSYSWDELFNGAPKINYPFETGIIAQLDIEKRRHRKFMIHNLQYTNLEIVEIPKNQNSFDVTGLFPIADEQLLLSYVNSSGKIKRTSLKTQFTPSSIPNYNRSNNQNFTLSPTIRVTPEPFYTDAEELETVVINVDKVRERKLKDKSRGRLDYFDDFKRSSTQIVTYLSNLGYQASDYNGLFVLFDTRKSANGPPVLVIDNVLYSNPIQLNGFLATDATILRSLSFGNVDYVEIFKNGTGAPRFRRPNQGDVIKITTDPKLRKRIPLDRISEFDFPITYNEKKEFYTPKYSMLNSNFYNFYGVFDWKKGLTLQDDNTLTFQSAYNGTEQFKLIIEGVSSSGQLIHKVVDLNLN